MSAARQLIVLAAAAVALPASAAPTLTSLYSFQGGADGSAPVSGLVADPTGTFFGTTPSGGGTGCGGAGCGTIYQLTPPAVGQTQWTESVLYSFSGGADGSTPMASLTVGAGGVLYGTTNLGGDANYGIVFELMPPAAGQTNWTENVLHSFLGGDDGSNPVASLLLDKDGSLYGTTFGLATGDPHGRGTVFHLMPPAAGQKTWTNTLVWKFLYGKTDGANPTNGVIMDKAGNLYGTTSFNGKSSNGNFFHCGTVFTLSPGPTPTDLWNETTLAFTQTVDLALCKPTGLLYMDSAGILYDTKLSFYPAGTQVNGGGVLSLAPPAAGYTEWTQTNIDKTVPGSFRPYSGVIPDAAGNLYGTSAGYFMRGTTPIAGATIFELVRPKPGGTWTQKILGRFDITNGALPKSPLLLAKDGTLYGTAQAGGAYGFGTVFALARPGK